MKGLGRITSSAISISPRLSIPPGRELPVSPPLGRSTLEVSPPFRPTHPGDPVVPPPEERRRRIEATAAAATSSPPPLISSTSAKSLPHAPPVLLVPPGPKPPATGAQAPPPLVTYSDIPFWRTRHALSRRARCESDAASSRASSDILVVEG